MSLMQKIKVVADMFTDTTMRLDVAQSITFLYDVYCHGRANEDQIRDDLYELFINIVNVARSDLVPEERDKIAKRLSEEFINTFKIEGMRKRVMAKYGSALRV